MINSFEIIHTFDCSTKFVPLRFSIRYSDYKILDQPNQDTPFNSSETHRFDDQAMRRGCAVNSHCYLDLI